MLLLVYVTLSVPHIHALLPRVLIKKVIPPLPAPPLLFSLFFVAKQLFIYIFDHDVSQLVVVSLSACH